MSALATCSKLPHGFVFGEDKAEHATHAFCGERDMLAASAASRMPLIRREPLLPPGRQRIRATSILFEGCQPGGHRDRISGQRSRLVDRAVRRNAVHDVGAATKCRRRHAAADDLAERRQVRRDAVDRLRTAESDAKPGHDLVKYQQGCRRYCIPRAAFRGTRFRAAPCSCCRQWVPR